jgi:hypothetical protein
VVGCEEQAVQALKRLGELDRRRACASGDAFVDSGTERERNAMTGVPHAIASIMTRPNGSGQSMGKSSAAAPARNGCFASSFTSPMSLIWVRSFCGSSRSLK